MMRSSAKTQNPTGNRDSSEGPTPKKNHHFESLYTLKQQHNFCPKIQKTFEFSRKKYVVQSIKYLIFRAKSQMENLRILGFLTSKTLNLWTKTDALSQCALIRGRTC